MTGRPIDDIAALYVDELCALDPFLAAAVGDTEQAGGHPDFTLDGYLTRAAHDRRVRSDLLAAEPTDEGERVARLAMVERLDVHLDYHDAGMDRLLNVRDCPVQQIPAALEAMPRQTSEDRDAFASQLGAIPESLAGYTETVREDLDVGLRPAARQVRRVVRQCQHLAQGHFTSMVRSADADDRTQRRLRADAQLAERAYRRFGRFLSREVVERARGDDAVGRDRYELAVRHFLGMTVDVEEAYAWSVAELDRIGQEMLAVADRIVPGASVAQAFEELELQPRYQVGSETGFVEWMTRLSQQAIESMSAHLPLEGPARTLECRLGEGGTNKITYTPPTAGFKRTGQLWWSPPRKADVFITWPDTVNVFHEGVPGRHVMASAQVSRSADLNRWQRDVAWVAGHEEGWAGYAEQLMLEQGWLDDPGDRLGALDAQRFRTARLCADIGLHCRLDVPTSLQPLLGERWDADGIARFLRSHSRLSDRVLRSRVDHYVGYAGQAVTHRLGERAWLDLRESARIEQGDSFTLKGFHDAALGWGPMGMGPLRQAVLAR